MSVPGNGTAVIADLHETSGVDATKVAAPVRRIEPRRVRIAAAALKRGSTVDQIEHAVVHHIDEFPERGDHALSMLVGPTQSGELLEVGVLFADDRITIEAVVQVMPARPQYLRKHKQW